MAFFRAGTAAAMLAMAAITAAVTPGAAGSPDPREILKADPSAGTLISGVPFIAQKDFDCGPASLAMVLNFHGINADADAIAREFETRDTAGTFTVDLLIAASEAGAEAHWIEGDMDKLKGEIEAGRPVVVFINRAVNPLPARHFAVAVGYLSHQGRDYVVLHSGAEPWLMAPVRKFERQWKRTGRMMMTVLPPAGDDKAGGKGVGK